ncbi:MAG: hypothetical protein CMH59_23985 [Myxococcales bacterium]|nr:hypothetical protein [Myxococcales bacterium]
MARLFLLFAAGHGFLAVALGAFGAHGLQGRLASLEDGAKRLGGWETAAHYQLAHALALGLVAWLASARPSGAITAAGWCFFGGLLLFSGSLYTMTLTGLRGLGAVTPFGGLLLLGGWGCVFAAAWRGAP